MIIAPIFLKVHMAVGLATADCTQFLVAWAITDQWRLKKIKTMAQQNISRCKDLQTSPNEHFLQFAFIKISSLQIIYD